MLLWIEDIHWADRSTRSFLRFLAASLTRSGSLVVATYRADELHRRHPLRPLLAELERAPRRAGSSSSASTATSSPTSSPTSSASVPQAEVVERLFGRSDGNPLFTEELLAAGVDGRGSLPPSLREALLLRVERLSPLSQRTLRLLGGRRARRPGAARRGRGGRRRRALGGAARGDRGPDRGHARLGPLRLPPRTAARGPLRRPAARRARRASPGARPRARAHAHRTATRPGWRPAIAHHYYSAGDQPRALKSALDAVRRRPQAARLRRGGGAARPGARALGRGSRSPGAVPGSTRESCSAAPARAPLPGRRGRGRRGALRAGDRGARRGRPIPSGSPRC